MKIKLLFGISLTVIALLLTSCFIGTDSATAPIAKISGLTSIDERSSTLLSGEKSTDADGSISSYFWGVEGIADHNISTSGMTTPLLEITSGDISETVSLVVSLTVKDDEGKSSTDMKIIEVRELDFAKLPPKPDLEAARVNIEGIDANNNGVRDDVEHAIYELHVTNYTRRQILLIGAEDYQKQILFGAGLLGNVSVEVPSGKFSDCLISYFEGENTSTPIEHLRILEGLVVNTAERQQAFWEYGKSLDGKVWSHSKTYSYDECIE